MKGVLFFLGSIFRWPVQNTKEFLILHVYLLGIYGITFFLRSIGLELSNLIFTVGLVYQLITLILYQIKLQMFLLAHIKLLLQMQMDVQNLLPTL